MFAANTVAVLFPLLASVSLDASLFEMGLLSAAGYVPYLGVSLFAGAWLARKPKRAIIVFCDMARALLLLAIPLAWWLDLLSVPTLLVVALLVGCFSVVADVGSASILPALVERDDLIDGNSKLELSASSAGIAGSALGGGIFQLLAGPVSMMINTVLFALSAFFTALIRGERKTAGEGGEGEEPEEPSQTIWRDMADGVAFVTGHATVRTLVLTTLVIDFFTAIAEPVALVFVTRTLDIPPFSVGLILAASGAGALAGAILGGLLGTAVGTLPAADPGLAGHAHRAPDPRLRDLAAEHGHTVEDAEELLADAFDVRRALPRMRSAGSATPDQVRAALAGQDQDGRSLTAAWGAARGGRTAGVGRHGPCPRSGCRFGMNACGGTRWIRGWHASPRPGPGRHRAPGPRARGRWAAALPPAPSANSCRASSRTSATFS
ncbi:MFS transporter [Streptomyces laurentii]|uniref:MFS transporter n=1 Tax=Streptomyces laurentii TaxID=39478 RepID=UPI0033C43C06